MSIVVTPSEVEARGGVGEQEGVLEHDPDAAKARAGLAQADGGVEPDLRATRFAAARKVLAQKYRPDALVQLIEIELQATPELERRLDLLLEKGLVLDGDLLEVAEARQAYQEVLALRPGEPNASEALLELDVAAQNWRKFADK